MSWHHTLKLGEFTSTIRFIEDEADLPLLDLTLVDTNTRALGPWSQPFVIPSGEEHKLLSTVENFLDHAAGLKLGRDNTIGGAGGGVVCDMAAFAASLYMRGTRLVLIPTTLLAMVDAAIGGKTGVDFRGWKNMIGTFYPAHEIVIWPQALNTLPNREYWCGMAEVIKHALLRPQPLWDFLQAHHAKIKNREAGIMEELIRLSIMVKVWYVENDFRESGLRAHLNLGHTFAHALETATGFQDWKHGEAVAWGMVRALELGQKLGLTPKHYVHSVHSLLSSFGFRLQAVGVEPEKILNAMVHDKKKKEGQVRFVLQEDLGKTVVRQVDTNLVRQVIQEGVE